MRRLFVLVALLVAVTSVSFGFSGIGSNGSISNPYYLYPTQNIDPAAVRVSSLTGRTQVSCALVGGQSTAVIILIGQSVTAANVNAAYTVTQSLNQQFNFQNGGCYSTADPLLGSNVSGGLFSGTNGSWGAELADKLITDAHYTRVILAPMAIGGTTIAQWSTSPLLDSIAVMGRRLAAAGLTCSQIIWGQGESDHGTSAPTYTAGLNTVISAFRSAGMNCPFLVNIETMLGGVVDSTVAGAQAVMSGTNVFPCFNMDTGIPNSGGNRYDGTHLAAPGRALAATGEETCVVAHP